MKTNWRTALSLALIGIGAASVFWTAYAAGPALGHFRWVLYVAGLLILAGAGLWRRRPSVNEIEVRRKAVAAMETALQERAEQVGRRQRELTRQLMRVHEWTEFPGGDPARGEAPPLDSAEDLGEKDRAVMALLEKRAEILFEKIKTNAYQEDGVFQRDRLSADMIDLVETVARIYYPDSKRPLLETSVESLLRAVNRISLQLLLLLEGLPLDIKSYNLQTTYETVRKGVRAYGVYKTAAPYFSYARPFYYLSRYAVGAAPMVLGAGWAVSELFKRSALRFSSNMAHRYALGLLRDMVLIVGGEAAGVFGGDYRLRDPNWIYGAELTDLMAAADPSPGLLRPALDEIGGLALKSEYDRIFLYRCMAAGAGVKLEQFADPTPLALGQREAVARRLERFHRRHIRGGAGDLSAWKDAAEARLGIKIRLAEKGEAVSTLENTVSGVFSLAGFLSEVKECDPEKWPAALDGTRLFRSVDPAERAGLLEDLTASPPMIFEYPDIDAGNRRADDYLADLAFLAARVAPRSDESDEAVLSAARYFRKKNLDGVRKRLDREYVDFLAASLDEASPEKRVHPRAARSLLYLLIEGESPRCLYKSITLRLEDGRGEALPFPPYAEPWLLGTDRRLVLAAVNRKFQGPPILVWTGGPGEGGADAAAVSRETGRFRTGRRITGGTWHWDRVPATGESPAIVVSGPAVGRSERYFRPLHDRVGGFA